MTSPTTIRGHDLKTVASDATGVVMRISLNSKVSIPKDGCELWLNVKDSYKGVEIDVSEGTQNIFVPLKPDEYTFHDLTCGTHFYGYLFDKTFLHFDIFEKKVTILMPIVFSISSETQGIFTFLNDKPTADMMVSQLPTEAKGRLIWQPFVQTKK